MKTGTYTVKTTVPYLEAKNGVIRRVREPQGMIRTGGNQAKPADFRIGEIGDHARSRDATDGPGRLREPQRAVGTACNPCCHRRSGGKKPGNYATRRDPTDRTARGIREPQCTVWTRDDVGWARYANARNVAIGEGRDHPAHRDASDRVVTRAREPHGAIRTARDASRAQDRSCRVLGDHARGGDSADRSVAPIRKPQRAIGACGNSRWSAY